jgi:NADH-quinone oxidoreductase subunit M
MLFLFILLSSVGLPLMNGFVGEFLVLSGSFQANMWWGVTATTGVIWSACYLLWLYQRTFFGEIHNPANLHLQDANLRERIAIWPLAALALIMGVASPYWTQSIDPATTQALEMVHVNQNTTASNAPLTATAPEAK